VIITAFFTLCLLIIALPIFAQSALAQSEMPPEEYKANLPTIPPHPQATVTQNKPTYSSPCPTENVLPSTKPFVSPTGFSTIGPQNLDKSFVGTILFVVALIIALFAVVTLKRKFQIISESQG
jgi:hypothetical protein